MLSMSSARAEHIYGHYVRISETVSDAEERCRPFAAREIQALQKRIV